MPKISAFDKHNIPYTWLILFFLFYILILARLHSITFINLSFIDFKNN